ncbi:MAG: ferritin-like domain-containing protein, partial [Gemmatimonadaceae bacterium]
MKDHRTTFDTQALQVTALQVADLRVMAGGSGPSTALPTSAIIAALGAAVPIVLAASARTAGAQGVASILDSLNFALTLEYLEDEFYRTGLTQLGKAFSGAESNAVQQISMHETAHVKFLTTIISDFFSSTPVAKPAFDFTAKGAYPDVFTNKATFLAVAQAFEDTGVRAYKGQAGNVASNKAVLSAALQIHAVEARHASQIRRLRGQKG